ncbi:MAG: hypothetical protein ACLP8A_02510 [Methylovirgula sp.]
MHPIQRLNRFMPFVIMFYLMMSLAQAHVLSWPHSFGGAESANGISLMGNLKREFAQFGKSSDRAFAYYDPTQYGLVGYPSP